MRALAAILAVAAALALAGCSSQPNSPVDPETVDASDYEVPFVILGILVIVGVVLLAVNLSNSGGNRPPPLKSAPPEPETWEHLGPGPAAATPAAKKSTKPVGKRRRAP
ncbi:MAG: hypothetical protein QOC71_483, partial [Thermoplasmata archaeon]|jgi:hypothetical protein|nr:hypothetical protein [Thermoplasmata archaeon]